MEVKLIVISLGSSTPGVTGSSQDSSAAILRVIAAALVSTLSAVGVGDRLTTVLVAITVTTLLTGLFFLALGFFKLGGLVCFIPYPVVGGFLAGTGCCWCRAPSTSWPISRLLSRISRRCSKAIT